MTTQKASDPYLAGSLLVAALLLGGATAHAAPPLDIALELRDGLPLIRAEIDGRPARLLLDTGGGAMLALRADWAPPDEPMDAAPASQDGQGQVQAQGRRWPIRRLSLDGQPVAGPLQAQTWNKARPPQGVDGYLGWGWLRQQRRLLIDYRAARLRVLGADAEESPLPADCGPDGDGGSFEMVGSLPVLRLRPADAAAEPLVLGLDTGASRNVVRPQALPLAEGGLMSLAGRPIQPGTFVAAELRLPPPLQGFLGRDFFMRHRLCLDPAQRRWWLAPLDP